MSISKVDLNAYLYFGFLPNQTGPGILDKIVDWLGEEADRKRAYERASHEELLAEGIRAFRSAVSSLLPSTTQLHVVPLSGGYDSRAILAELLRLGLRDRVVAVTFGTPGTLDYDIGGYVARTLGVKHEYIDLSNVDIQTAALLDVVRSGANWTYTFDAYFNLLVQTTFGPEGTYWSGFLGDASAGNQLQPEEPQDWQTAQGAFLAQNRFCPLTLHEPGWDPHCSLPGEPFCDRSIVGFEDQLNFGIRKNSCIYNIVLSESVDVRAPFFTPDWVRFSLSLPRSYRVKQQLYIEMLVRAYPLEFSLPMKNTFGLPPGTSSIKFLTRRIVAKARRELTKRFHWIPPFVHPMENYIDIDEAIRRRADIRDTVYDNLQGLKKRDVLPWIDLDQLWQQHLQRRGQHGRALA